MTLRKSHEQCFDLDAEPEDIKRCVAGGHRVLILLRGASGSGKTHLVRKIISWKPTESDHKVHTSESLILQQVSTKTVRASLVDYTHLVIVDADNEERGTIRKLAELAFHYQYELYVVQPKTAWRYHPEECAKRSSREENLVSIEETIRVIKNSPIEWKHLIPGGESSVKLKPFHDEYPSINSVESMNGGSLLSPKSFMTESTSSSSCSSPALLFSMKPPEKKKIMRSVGTQVETHSIVFVMAGGVDMLPSCCCPEVEEVHTPQWKNSVRMIDRAEHCPDPRLNGPYTPLLRGKREDIEFGMLRAAFWYTDLMTIHHQLQTLGFANAVQFFLTLGEPIGDSNIPVDDEVLYDFVQNEECSFMSNMTIDEEMAARRIERSRLKRWAEKYNDTASDELIALHLQEDLDEESNRKSHFQAVDRENLALLQRMFPNTKPGMIRNVFVEVASKDLELAKECLMDDNNYYDPNYVRNPTKPTWSSTVATHQSPGPSLTYPLKTDSEKKNHFLKESPKKFDLETVQRQAVEERKKLQDERANNTSYMSHQEHRNTVLMERARRLHESTGASVKKIDQNLRLAHNDPYQLDLHYMTVVAAKQLVMDAVEAVQYKKRCDPRARNRITVVTGSGNNSRGGARIKPEVANMLREKRIPFEQINDGCILIKA